MKRITREMFDQVTLEASLRRLGIVELEERLEFSPLLSEGGLQETQGDTSCCVCKMPDDDMRPDIRLTDLIGGGNDGDGSTGGVGGGVGPDGGLIR